MEQKIRGDQYRLQREPDAPFETCAVSMHGFAQSKKLIHIAIPQRPSKRTTRNRLEDLPGAWQPISLTFWQTGEKIAWPFRGSATDHLIGDPFRRREVLVEEYGRE